MLSWPSGLFTKRLLMRLILPNILLTHSASVRRVQSTLEARADASVGWPPLACSIQEFAWYSLLYELNVTVLFAFHLTGMVLRFNYFLKNDFGLLLMLFWLFGLAMTSYSYLLSVFVSKTQGAVYLGFSVFIVGWVFQTVQFLGQLPYTPSFYYSTTNK